MTRELTEAARNGQLETVKSLTVDGIDLDSFYRDENALLLTFGYDVHQTPLIIACANKQVATVNFLIEQGTDVNTADNYQKTPLMYAVTANDQTIVKSLLRAGANMEARDEFGVTALVYAVQNKDRINSANILLSYGADADARDQKGNTALIWAAESNNNLAVRCLLEYYLKSQMLTCSEGITSEQAKAAIVSPYVNIANTKGRTALMQAASVGCAHTVELLLRHGADVNARDNAGNNALILSISKAGPYSLGSGDYPGVAKILLNYGADINAKNNTGKSAISVASYSAAASNSLFFDDYMFHNTSSKKLKRS